MQDIQTEEVTSGQYSFKQTTYNGISIVMEKNSGYYNATKMCKDNGKRFHDIRQTEYWIEYISKKKSKIYQRENSLVDLILDLSTIGEKHIVACTSSTYC